MASAPREPRNFFYLLLLLASLVFVVTALAYAVVPTLEEKAVEAGQPPPPSPFRDALRKDGWIWLLVELVFLIIFAAASMILDRYRSLKVEKSDESVADSK